MSRQDRPKSQRFLRWPPQFLHTVRFKLVVFVSLVIAVVATAVGSSAYFLARRSVQERIAERLDDLVTSRTALLSAHLARLERDAFANTTRLRAFVSEHEEGLISDSDFRTRGHQILLDLREEAGPFAEIALADAQGRVISATDNAMLGTEVSPTSGGDDPQDRTRLGPIESRPNGQLVATLVAPIRDLKGEIIGLFLGLVDMVPIRDQLFGKLGDWASGEILVIEVTETQILRPFRPELAGVALPLDRRKEPVLARVLSERSGHAAITESNDRSVLTAFGPGTDVRVQFLPSSWYVVAKVGADEAFAPVKRMREVTVLLASVMALLILGITFVLSRRFTAPLASLAHSALATASNTHTALELPHRKDEIGLLAAALKAMHESLLAAHDVLEQRVAARTAELEDANRKLVALAEERSLLARDYQNAKELAEASSKAKGAFLASMSHEIRTPMNGILGMAELLATTPLAPVQREYLGMVRESAESLLQVINDILDFSRMEAGRFEVENRRFELRELLGSTMSAFADRAHRKKIELAFRVDPRVPDNLVGDPLRLRQVLVNLVGNSIKFTEAGEIVVDVQTSTHAKNQVVLSFEVRDTGIGIPEERLSAIFEPFEQADGSSTRRFGGAGLGLTIAARLVQKLGGEIEVTSQVGAGSSFRFTVRLGLSDAPTITPSLPPEALIGMRVMIVDDNATNRRILEELLGHWKMDVIAVARPTEVKGILIEAQERGRPYQLVLLDAEMPEMDGFAVAKQLLDERKIGSPIIMMLSSMDRPGDAKRCKELGIELHLLKPIRHSELMSAIRCALGIMPERRAEPTELLAMAPLHILVAEDSRVSQRLTMELLKNWGHTATLAANGRDALELFQRQTPADAFDLVLMDVQMPEMDGLEVTRAIRTLERETGGHIPIIAMTAHAMKGDREQCLAAGMDGYLAKPIRSDELRFALERHRPATAKPLLETRSDDEPMDWQTALHRVDGHEAILRSMAEAFIEDCPAWLATIEQAIANHDADALRRAAHTLKGAAQTLEAAPVAKLAQALEAAGRENQVGAATSRLNRDLAERVDALIDRLAQHLLRTAESTSQHVAESSHKEHHEHG